MMKIFKCSILLLVSALVNAGASEKQPALSSYPKDTKVWLGAYSGDVEVSPKTDLVCTRYGDVRWLIAEGKAVKEGDALAYMAYEKITHSEAQLSLAKDELKLNLDEAKWSNAEDTQRVNREMATLASEIAKLDFSEAEKNLAGPKLVERIDRHRENLKKQLVALRAQNKLELRAEVLRIETQKLKHEMASKELEHKELLNDHAIYAPHEGVLEKISEGNTRSDTVVGKVERVGRAMVKLKMIDAEIKGEEPELLEISVADTKGDLFKGGFDKVFRLPGVRNGPETYQFELLISPDVAPDSGLTGERIVNIYRKIGREAHMVPKSKFLFTKTKEVHEMGWKRFIESMWPESEIVFIGPHVIAVAAGS